MGTRSRIGTLAGVTIAIMLLSFSYGPGPNYR